MSYCDKRGCEFRTRDGHDSNFCVNCGNPKTEAHKPQPQPIDPEGAALVRPEPIAERPAETGDPKDYNGEVAAPRIGLPTDYDQRKSLPIFEGCIMYFPLALLAVSEVSRLGNEQHNPGEPLHWARGKSMDQYNTAVRHMMDHRLGGRYDTDGGRHLAKAAWRVLAALQLDIEQEALQAEAEGRCDS
jgi:hypothetical protein